MTLQKKIGVIVLAGLAIGLSVFSWAGIQSVQKSVERTLDERLTMARVLAGHLDGTLTYVVNIVRDAGPGALSATDFAARAREVREALARSRIIVTNLVLVDAEGKVLGVEPPSFSVGPYLTYPALKQTLEKGLPAVSALEVSTLSSTPVVFVSTPVTDRQGKVLGAVIGAIDVKQSDNDAFSPMITAGKTGYVEIIDGNGIILARSAQASRPGILEKSDHPVRFAELISQQKATVGTCHRCHETETSAEIERKRDILAFAPLSSASWGIAIRQAEEEALAPTRELEQRFLLLGIIIVVSLCLLVWLMMREIVSPIRILTSAAKRIAAGDFKAQIAVSRRDEIGELSTAFRTMTRELAKSRDELVSRNEELSALNSIVATISESLNLEEVLAQALASVLDITKTESGHIFLRETDDVLKTVKDIGVSAIFQCPEAGRPGANCVCHQVLSSGQTMLAIHPGQCPGLAASSGKDSSFFVCIPLKSKSRTLGIMNVAGTESRIFNSADFRLLNSIGYHVGLAIENAVLYEETRQKEELRGQLLKSVISAQEEERKRVARELHDEYGQVMTGLIMSIESLQNTVSAREPQVGHKLEQAKSMAEQALNNLRRLTLDLRPSVLDDLGLVAAVRAYARNRLEPSGVQVEFEAKGLRQRLDPVMETALFRILQEAIHNVGKHAQAHNVRIGLEANDGRLTATVRDDGQGFDLEAVSRSKIGTQSLGLLGIRERATLLGGTLSIKSEVGRGTCLTVEIPVGAPLAPGVREV